MDKNRRDSNASATTAEAAVGQLEAHPEGKREYASSPEGVPMGQKAAADDLLRDAFDDDDGEDKQERIQFKTMGWVQAGALISAETIALGILSFPSVFHRLGMAIGIVVTLAMALISWWTGYILVQMKVNFPGIHNYADAGRVVGGKWLHALFAIMLAVKVTFVAGSHSLSGGIALTNISSNAICSVAYAAIISVVSFLLILPRTFEKASYISFVSVISILTACIIVIAASGTQSLETLQRATGKDLGPVDWHAVGSPGLVDAVGAISNIVFAYGGHVAIFSFCAEMKEPQGEPRDGRLGARKTDLFQPEFRLQVLARLCPDRGDGILHPGWRDYLLFRRTVRHFACSDSHLLCRAHHSLLHSAHLDHRRRRRSELRGGQVHLDSALPRHTTLYQQERQSLERLDGYMRHDMDSGVHHL